MGEPETYIPRTLSQELSHRGRLSFEECLELGLTLNLALGFLHRHGLIHRDVKPSNIIFVNGVPKLADIGLVTEFAGANTFVGTEGYIPPEGPNSPQADIYGLGKVLYEASMGKDRKEFPEPFTDLRSAAESEALLELNAIILKACAPDLRERYQSAEEMNADLALLHSGKSVKRKLATERRVKTLTRVLAISAAAILVAVGGYFYQARQTQIVSRLAKENLDLARQSDVNGQESRTRLVQLQVAKGTEHMNKGELSDSLSWFSAALANVTNNSKATELHRIRLQSVLENHPKLTHLFRHEGRVFRAAFTPDGSSLVTHSTPDVVKIFDLATGELKFSLAGTNQAYEPHYNRYSPALIFNADGSRVIIRGLVEGVDTEIFDLKERRQLTLSSTNRGESNRILDSTDGRRALVQTSSSTAHYVDLDTGEALSTKIQITGEIITGRLSQHNSAAALLFKGPASTATVGDTNLHVQLQVWKVKSGEVIGPALLPERSRFNLRFLLTDEGKQAVLGFNSSIISMHSVWPHSRRFNMESGEPLDKDALVHEEYECLSVQRGDQWVAHRLPKGGKKLQNVENNESVTIEEPAPIRYIGFSLDGLLVATITDHGTVRVWNKATGELLLPILKHALLAYGAEFSPDGTRLATCSEDRTVRVWDLTASSQPRLTMRQKDEVLDAAFSPDGARIAIAARYAASTRVWDAATGQPLTPPLTETPAASALRFSPDGQRLLVLAKKGRISVGVYLWQMGAPGWWRSNCLWLHRKSLIDIAAFSPDSARLITSGRDKKACIWDASNGDLLVTLEHEQFVTEALFDSTGGQVITTTYPGGPIRFWDSYTGRLLKEVQSTNLFSHSVALSSDGRYLAAGESDQSVHVWDLQNKKTIGPLWQGGSPVQVKFSPQGSILVTYGLSRAKIWDLGKPEIKGLPLGLSGSEHPFRNSVEFSRDGRFLVQTTTNRARLWDCATSEQLWVQISHGESVSSAIFNPAADEFLTSGSDKAVRVWRWKPCQYPMEDIEQLGRLLSATALEGAYTPLKAEVAVDLHERLRRKHPEAFRTTTKEQVAWHEKMAKMSQQARLWTSMLSHIDRALELDPKLPESSGGDEIFFDRGNVNGELGNYADAAADFKRAIQLDPDKILSWQGLLSTALVQNLTNQYAEICAKIYDRFSWTTNIGAINGLGWKMYFAWFAGRTPHAISDYNPLIKGVNDALLVGASGLLTSLRGKLLFRAGRIDEAIPDLEQEIVGFGSNGHNTAENLFVLAMAYQQRGRREDAQRMFTRGCALLEELDHAFDSKAPRNWHERIKAPRNWHERVIHNSLRKEAAAVLGM